jgi:hypothetical protein
MKQLGMSKATLIRFLAFAKSNPEPVAVQKKGSGHPNKLFAATLDLMKKKLQTIPTLTATQPKKILELNGASVRTVQRNCKNTLNRPFRRLRMKPRLTEGMRIQRLDITRAPGHWDVDDWKRMMFLIKAT